MQPDMGAGTAQGGRGLSDAAVLRVAALYVVARVPAAAVWLSIVLDVSTASGSFTAAGGAVAAYGVGVALVAPLLGRMADRIGARPLLLASAAVQLPALLLLASAADNAGFALLVPAFVAGAVQPPLLPCMRAGWALLVPDEDRRQACFSFDAVLGEVVDLGAPLIAVALNVSRAGHGSLGVVAIAVAATTVLFAFVVPSQRAPERAAGPRPRVVTRPVLSVLTVVCVLTAGLGAVEVGAIALADSESSRSSAGLLLALFTLGSIVGGTAHGRWRWGAAPTNQLLLLMLPLGLGIAAAALLPHHTAVTGLALVLAGVTVAPLVAVLLGMLQSAAQEGAVTETFTYATTANFLGVAAGSVIAGRARDVASGSWPDAGTVGLLMAVCLVAAAIGCVLVLRFSLPGPEALEAVAAVEEVGAGPRQTPVVPAPHAALDLVAQVERVWDRTDALERRNAQLTRELRRLRGARS